MTFEIIDGAGFEFPPSRLDALATRMANDVISRKYKSAREAANKNVVEYAAHETTNEVRLNTQVGNFTRKIVKTLCELGYDRRGAPIVTS